MAAVTIHSDFRAQEEEICHCFHLFPFYLPLSDGTGGHDLSFLIFSFKLASSLFACTLIKRVFIFSLLPASGVMHISEVVDISPANLIPSCDTSSLAFLMMCSAYNSNKQGDNKQPCHTPFSVWNQSIVPCMVLTVASWPAYRFLSRQVRWSRIPISLRWCYQIAVLNMAPNLENPGVAIRLEKVNIHLNSQEGQYE